MSQATSGTDHGSPLRDAPAVKLPMAGGGTEQYVLRRPPALDPTLTGSQPPTSRQIYAAPHVVANAASGGDRGVDGIDWDATIAFREHLWSLGLGVAEAMDTAQRGMGLSWDAASQLIRLSADAAQGRKFAAGAATDHLAEGERHSLDAIAAAYIEQCQFMEDAGAVPVVMASSALAAVATRPEDYTHVYGKLLAELSGPVVLHWLGDVFDPALAGYWGAAALDQAADAMLDVVSLCPGKIDGVKVSILDAQREAALRRRMPAGVRIYTGDDYDYVDLIRGDDHGHSDALLGAFNPLARIAAAAVRALDHNDVATYDALLEPTLPLSRKVFAAPTQLYKSGVVFLAYLNGHQDHFRMLGGLETSRSALHYATLVRLADAAGVLDDPDLAAHRVGSLMASYGVS